MILLIWINTISSTFFCTEWGGGGEVTMLSAKRSWFGVLVRDLMNYRDQQGDPCVTTQHEFINTQHHHHSFPVPTDLLCLSRRT